MKNTVYTVITVVLLLATLCLPAAAQTWTLDNWYAGPDDDRNNGNYISDIEFRDDHQVFFGKYDRLYKWDLNTNWLWWHDFSGDEVNHVEVPRDDSSVVIHSVDRRGDIYIRDASDLSRLVTIGEPDSRGYIRYLSLDVDSGGYYIIYQYQASKQAFPDPAWVRYYINVMDIWTGEWDGVSYFADSFESPDGDMILDPTYADDGGSPRWFRQTNPTIERFFEYTGTSLSDTFITTAWDPIDKIAARPRGSTRLAALDSANVIHIWNWMGDHLFTFNESEGYAAHDNILEFTNNGELLVTAYGRWVRFWDMSQQAEDHSFWVDDMDDDESIESLAFSDNGKLMALGSSKGTAYIYEWTGGSAPAAPAKEVEPAQPTALLSNYPNPFNPETWIPYQLSETAEVTVTIHASDGKLVRTLELGQVPAGVYSEKDRAAYWDGQNEQGEPVASGVYFYTLKAGEFSATRKMVIRK